MESSYIEDVCGRRVPDGSPLRGCQGTCWVREAWKMEWENGY